MKFSIKHLAAALVGRSVGRHLLKKWRDTVLPRKNKKLLFVKKFVASGERLKGIGSNISQLDKRILDRWQIKVWVTYRFNQSRSCCLSTRDKVTRTSGLVVDNWLKCKVEKQCLGGQKGVEVNKKIQPAAFTFQERGLLNLLNLKTALMVNSSALLVRTLLSNFQKLFGHWLQKLKSIFK